MGASSSTLVTRCERPERPEVVADDRLIKAAEDALRSEHPPAMRKVQSFEEKMFDKFRKQPLIPIGCAGTVYFLVSGIKSFSNQDSQRAQKMMRLRVGAQFATLAFFVYYVGLENINFDVAPAYYRAKKEAEERESQQQG
eukprot:Nitzschia sp. Nitz4//scaffold290_size23356//1227//1722//NITZ4_008484-RA/size23356-processed-gene-0.38-mRNA-1//1//CDS//3329546081//7459//frame0